MKTEIKSRQLLFNCFRANLQQVHWASLALMLCIFGFLLPARGQDPNPSPYYPSNATVSLGATASFRVSVSSSYQPLTFQWQHERTNLLGATNYLLVLTNLTVGDAGGYMAWITNASGAYTNTRAATLTVDPTFIKITTGAIVTDREPSLRASWCDYDGNGFQDLFVANCGGSASKNSLYHNNGDGTFIKITTNALSATAGWCSTGAWADVDNDGDPDLYVGGTGPGRQSVFYRNDGNGRFTAVSILPTRDAAGHDSYFVSWGDYDNDGWVDLFIPTASLGSHRLFRNLGDLNFMSMTAAEVGEVITPSPKGSSALANWIDYDNDNDLDLYLHNWGGYTNALYLNSGKGFFTRTFAGSIATNVCDPNWDDIFPYWGDYDNDGYLDAFVKRSGFAGTLHHNLGGTNSVVVAQSGLEIPSDSMAVTWGDYDNDGNLDLFIANNPGWPYKSVRGANLLFRNNGDGTFSAVDVGSPIWEGRDKWDPYWIDYDNDGFLDLFIAAGNFAPEVNYLYRNNLRAIGNTNHWLKISLVGKASNACGIGAKVRVTANIRGKGVTQLRTIDSPGYFGSNQGLLAHFGLGDATSVDLVRIEWPSGNVQELTDVAPDRLLTLTEPTLIAPIRPSASLNGSVTLTITAVAGATYQWQFNGVDLAGQTNRTLNLKNIVADQQGHYSVVASNATTVTTNFVYLYLDPTFTKITECPIVNDRLDDWYGSWVDYDNDGRLDLLLNALTNQWRLYHNDGGTTFSTVTNGVMGEYKLRAMFGVWADPDNDDDLDMPEAGSPLNMLWNDGRGDFTRVPIAGVPGESGVIAWGDFDQDGFLDAFFVSWIAGGLLHNEGDGTFTINTNSFPYIGNDMPQVTCAIDYDDDGDLDLVPVRAQGRRIKFYQNDGVGKFTETTPQGIGSELTYSLSAAWGDFDNDGDLDVFFGGWNNLKERFYINNGDGTFTRWAGQPALFESYDTGAGSWATWGDFDNDGDLDLAVSKGDKAIRLWRNRGDGSFVQVLTGNLVNESGSFNQSGCWVDFNQDGNLDFFVATLNGGIDKLYLGNGNGNHWLEVKPKGTLSNRMAVGARIFATANIRGKIIRQMRVITASDSDQTLIAHFGLGDATKVTRLRIEWPSGMVQEFANVATNQFLTLWEPPAISAAVREDGACELSIKAEPNQGWQIQASSDLLTWQTLTTFTNTTAAFQFTDTAAAGMNSRFYRVESK